MRTVDQTTRETTTVDVVGGALVVTSGGGGGTQDVNVTNTSLPVTGTVAVSNLPATQPVSGTVAVSNFPTTQFVAPAAPFPVSGSVTTTQPALTASITSATIAIGASTYQSSILDTGAIGSGRFYLTLESTAAPTSPTITLEHAATNSATALVPMVDIGSGTTQMYNLPAAFPAGANGVSLVAASWLRYVRYTVNLGAAATAAVAVRVYRQTL